MSYKLVEATDKFMTRKRIVLPREPHLYPSESSVIWTDHHGITRVAGTCLRRAYFRYTGTAKASPPDAYSEWIFALGKAVEEILVEQYKQMGIWVANNIKFYDKERNISGEIDVILSEPDGTLYVAEIKSFFGYNATKELIGNKSTSPAPKTGQMMQTLVYLDQCKDLFPYAKMIYYSRDSANRTEFDITLVEDNGVHRPAVNGAIDYRFTMEDIYDRYALLREYIKNEEVPPPDFELVWDAEKVEQRKAIGEVSKSAYNNEKGKKKIGDWNCRYCGFCDSACWKS